MNYQIPEYAKWRVSLDEMIKSAEKLIESMKEMEQESWCCGEPPDEAGLCPVCREHIK